MKDCFVLHHANVRNTQYISLKGAVQTFSILIYRDFKLDITTKPPKRMPVIEQIDLLERGERLLSCLSLSLLSMQTPPGTRLL